jgi:lysozyme family protein
MKILRRQKNAAVKPAGERRPASADARLTLSTFGGSLLALESRIMFDGAAVATASTVTTEHVAQSQADASVSAEKAVTVDTAVHAPTGEAPTGEAAPPTGDQTLIHALATYDSAAVHHEILFISASVID